MVAIHSLDAYDLSFTMKSSRTPIKLKVQDISKSRKSPGRGTLSRRQANDFQPGLYISPRFGEEEVLAIKEAFDTYDSNGNGLLTPNDLKVALFHQGFHASKETVYNIIAEYDEECLGGLNFAAFMKIISSQPAETQPLSEMKKVFRRMDRDNKGYLDRRDLEILLKSLGEQWQEREIEMVLQKADSKDGYRISFQQFCKIMHHPSSLF